MNSSTNHKEVEINDLVFVEHELPQFETEAKEISEFLTELSPEARSGFIYLLGRFSKQRNWHPGEKVDIQKLKTLINNFEHLADVKLSEQERDLLKEGIKDYINLEGDFGNLAGHTFNLLVKEFLCENGIQQVDIKADAETKLNEKSRIDFCDNSEKLWLGEAKISVLNGADPTDNQIENLEEISEDLERNGVNSETWIACAELTNKKKIRIVLDENPSKITNLNAFLN